MNSDHCPTDDATLRTIAKLAEFYATDGAHTLGERLLEIGRVVARRQSDVAESIRRHRDTIEMMSGKAPQGRGA